MWRVLPILAGFAFLRLIVPWPEVATLVLGDGNRTESHALANGGAATVGGRARVHLEDQVYLVKPPITSPTLARVTGRSMLNAAPRTPIEPR
jgi:hypothetical protein